METSVNTKFGHMHYHILLRNASIAPCKGGEYALIKKTLHTTFVLKAFGNLQMSYLLSIYREIFDSLVIAIHKHQLC